MAELSMSTSGPCLFSGEAAGEGSGVLVPPVNPECRGTEDPPAASTKTRPPASASLFASAARPMMAMGVKDAATS